MDIFANSLHKNKTYYRLSTEKKHLSFIIYNLSFPWLFLTFWLLFGQAKSNKASRQLKYEDV